ncbi:Vps51/Vps67-domain-containing protein [Multifurca ochricompacta]|uniref:Vacuolar protein sorting-associated protein 51 homolog n=1 Tax=Multifurca ochricompacta TaxID=376703 RepID=A0AAD4M6D8_9AGAM|nr:Vps51/Vps67-domain-containing protein [Multifurca ochricompacta]
MSLPPSPSSSTPTSTTPPRQRSLNKTLPSPLRPNSPSQLVNSQRSSAISTASPRHVSDSTASPATPPLERSKTRARDLLRKHYGLNVTPPPPSGRPMDPMDLDSPAFDAKAYYDQLITTASLTTLLKKENELLTEMKQLEGERQSLVYNHHHELIDATDTISAMRNRAESLDSDLELLKAAFSEISRLSAEVAIEGTASSN